ncbi:Protein RER1D [Arabidopsis thaliana]
MEDEPGSENEADTIVASPLAKWRIEFSKSFQNYLDRSAPNIVRRWLVTLVATVIYIYRVYSVYGYFVISYGLATYILNLLIGFLSPKVDPELEALDPDSLPVDESDEYKPFVRRLPEFKFWYAATKAFVVAFVMTFFSFLDVPVFWPILLCYWLVLYSLTMKRLIVHMFKYRYFPFDVRKPVKLLKFLVNSKGDGGDDRPSSSNSSQGNEKQD